MSQITSRINLVTEFANCRDIYVEECLAVLKADFWKFMSWGPHAYTRIGKKALRFAVNGHHHKGHVYISVNGMDLYNVTLTSLQGTIVERITDIYVEDLFETIDKKVEYIDAYKD